MADKIVKKAVIAAAGMGTRFLPQTKAMPKEMLPIINKPVIQIVVEGLVEAGVEDIIIVTGPTKRAIEDHFDRSLELEDELVKKGKTKEAEQLKEIAEQANFIYVRQKGEPKGNARPIINASHIVGNEPFFFFFADDFFTGDKSTAIQLLEAYKKVGTSVAALMEVSSEDVVNYGIADISETIDDRLFKIKGIAEKPSEDEAPSNLAALCGFLFAEGALPIIEKEKTGSDGEIAVSHAVEEIAEKLGMHGLKIDGTYYDTGRPETYIKTLLNLALEDKDMGNDLREYLKDRLER
jgi:UTP--glucose-1-phosphate uridylyltransferase